MPRKYSINFHLTKYSPPLPIEMPCQRCFSAKATLDSSIAVSSNQALSI